MKLLPLENKDIETFKRDMQEAFQKGAKEGDYENTGNIDILPENDIDKSLFNRNAKAYKVVKDDKIIGGAIINIDKENNINHLDFLYVKYGVQSRGVGFFIWSELKKLYPETKVWETVTPYFEKRNIHFYVNKCGFHIVEFYNAKHKDPNSDSDEMFRFQKIMK